MPPFSLTGQPDYNRLLLCFLALVFSLGGIMAARAADVQVVGLMVGKALLVIDGARPRILSIGQVTANGVRLIHADTVSATIEIAGRRQTLGMSQSVSLSGARTGEGADNQVTLHAGQGGHFFATATINGNGSLQLLVDTGATMVTINDAEATRLGIRYLHGARVRTATANGIASAWQIKLDSIRIGNITLTNVDTLVMESTSLAGGLLGMSFLDRMTMKRDGMAMTLSRRY